MLFGSCIKPKKQFKVQIIGILEEIDSFYRPKMHLWEGAKKNWTGPPPSFGQKPKEQQFFLGKLSLTWLQWQHLFVKRPYWTNSTVSTVNMNLKQYWWSYYPQHNKPIVPNAWWSTLAPFKNHYSDVNYLLKGSFSGFVVKPNFLDPLCLSCCTFSLKSRTSRPTLLSTKES